MTVMTRLLIALLALALISACGTTEVIYVDRDSNVDDADVDGGADMAIADDLGAEPMLDAGLDAGPEDAGPDDLGPVAIDSGPVGGCAAFMPYTWNVEKRPRPDLSTGAFCSPGATRVAMATLRTQLFEPCPGTCTCETFSEPCSVRRTVSCPSGTNVEHTYTFSASPTSFSGTIIGHLGSTVCVSDVVGTWVSP